MAVSLLYQRGVLILLLSLIFAQSYGQANITNYVFSSSTATAYSTIFSNNQVVANRYDDETYTNLPIGFDFWYMGNRYTRFSVSSNGWMALGSSISGPVPANNLSGSGTRPVIAPLWDDLAVFPGLLTLLAGTINYSTTGTVGSQVTIIQWETMRWDKNSTGLLGAVTVVISFQVKLYENGNVQFFYSPNTGDVNNGSASVGITSTGTGAGSFLSLNNLSSTASVSSSTETNTIAQKPVANQSYTFNPTELAAPSSLNFSRVGSTGMRLNWTDNSTGEAGFVIYRSTNGGATYTYLATTPANATFYDDTSLTNGITYYYRVFTLRENLSLTSAVGSQTANCTSFVWGTTPNSSGASNTGPVCAGYPLTLTANAVDGATYSWTGPNGFTSALQNPVIASYSDAAKGIYTVTITRNGCTLNANTTVNSMGQGRWTGVSGSNWTTANNWCDGLVPTSTVNVSIPSTGVANEPSLTNTGNANNINIQAGRTLTIGSGGNLQIAGAITNAGTAVTTAGKVTFNGTAAQTIPLNVFSANTILNLELNNNAGVTLNGALRLTGTLTATAGVFNANGFLILASSETLTAEVAPIPTGVASIQGQVKVERFVKGGSKTPYRTNRMFSSPVYDNSTTFTNSGTRSAKFSQLIDDIIVTGNSGAINGFDSSESTNNEPSAWTYASGFVPITNITTTASAGRGMYAYFRGNRDNFIGKTTIPFVDPENTIVDFDGILNQGDISLNLSAGNHFLGNPYAATIDWESSSWGSDKGSFTTALWIWNPATRSYATYSNGVGTLGGSRYIASGQSFFAQSTAAGTIKFKESIKASTIQPPTLLMSVGDKISNMVTSNSQVAEAANSILRINMKPVDSFGEDEAVIVFKEGADATYTTDDALHIDGEVVNVSSIVGTRRLTINFLPTPANNVLEIPLNVSVAATGNYSFQFNLDQYYLGHTLQLKDNYLQKIIPVVAGGSTGFSIDKSQASSYGVGRFSVIVSPPSVLPVVLLGFTAKKQNDGVLLSWTTSSEVNHKAFKLYRAGEDGNYVLLNDFSPKAGGNYNYLDVLPLSGFNYYKLVQVDLNGVETEIDPISVDFNVGSLRALNVYPNPVEDKFTIKLDGNYAEKLKLGLYDLTGRILKEYKVSKAELTNGYEVDVLELAQGMFFIRIEETGTRKIVGVHKVVKR